ncbi:hypothetical protein LRR18_18210, partial [Mangrovimonas sp. AS39]|uniref:hypothetical protein n=1 Tax=Mangrovimonas futianensis TaxID=2895523 RepID=UPI001E553A51
SKLIEISCGQAQLSSVLIDCKFPDYERVIPKPNGRSAEFSAEGLSEAVKRATVVFLGAVDVKNKVQSIKFEAADGLLKVFARSGGVGEEAIEAET